jgi:hypothetical protein
LIISSFSCCIFFISSSKYCFWVSKRAVNKYWYSNVILSTLFWSNKQNWRHKNVIKWERKEREREYNDYLQDLFEWHNFLHRDHQTTEDPTVRSLFHPNDFESVCERIYEIKPNHPKLKWETPKIEEFFQCISDSLSFVHSLLTLTFRYFLPVACIIPHSSTWQIESVSVSRLTKMIMSMFSFISKSWEWETRIQQ